MAKGKAKSRFNFNDKTGCEYENGTWCFLPKFKRCVDCIRCADGSKACRVTSFDTHSDDLLSSGQ